MDSRRGLCLALVVAALALPQAAQAAVRCVPAGGPGCTTSHASINAAVTAASNDDTIRIAAGTYAESVSTTKRLNFVGAGSGTLASATGATVIAPPAGTAITLSRGGSVRSLRAVGATGFSGGSALVLAPDVDGTFAYSVTDVIGLGGLGTDITLGFGGYGLYAVSSGAARIVNLTVSGGAFRGGNGFLISGYGGYLYGVGLTGSLAGASLSGPTNGAPGLVVSGGSTVDATGISAQGTYAAQFGDATVNLRRSRIEGVYAGLYVYESSTAPATYVSVTDSLILVTPTSPFDAVALSAQTSSGSAPLTVPVRGSTIIARGLDPLAAVAARPPSGAPTTNIDLRNSIARLEGGAESGEGDVAADRGTVTAAHSDFATRLQLNGGTVTAPGSGTNLTGDPLFNAGAFTLKSTSPLIDRGDPSLVTPGELDLAGNSRSAGAAPDMGAFEFQPPAPPPPPPPPPPPNAPPGLTMVSMTNSVFAPVAARAAGAARARNVKRGTRFRYLLSEAATVSIVIDRRARGRRAGKRCVKPTRRNAGHRKCKRWVRVGRLRATEQAGRQSTPFTGRFGKRALAPGRYRARISAKDVLGARSTERRLAFRIVRAS
jgi:hypothetical protein